MVTVVPKNLLSPVKEAFRCLFACVVCEFLPMCCTPNPTFRNLVFTVLEIIEMVPSFNFHDFNCLLVPNMAYTNVICSLLLCFVVLLCIILYGFV